MERCGRAWGPRPTRIPERAEGGVDVRMSGPTGPQETHWGQGPAPTPAALGALTSLGLCSHSSPDL